MTGEEFLQLYLHNIELRQYIVDQAKRRSRRKCLQEEYVQEAWLAISCIPISPKYCDVEILMSVAQKAIYSSYWQNYKETLLSRSSDHCLDTATPKRFTDDETSYFQDDNNVIDQDWRN